MNSTKVVIVEFGGVDLTASRVPRVLMAKPGLDGHDRGARVVARALQDAGFQVIYTGIRQTPEMIVEKARAETVDAIGLSILSGAHLDLLPKIMHLLKEDNLSNIVVFAGGILPKEDYPALEAAGIKGLFGPGASLQEIVEFVSEATGFAGSKKHLRKEV